MNHCENLLVICFLPETFPMERRVKVFQWFPSQHDFYLFKHEKQDCATNYPTLLGFATRFSTRWKQIKLLPSRFLLRFIFCETFYKIGIAVISKISISKSFQSKNEDKDVHEKTNSPIAKFRVVLNFGHSIFWH